MNRPPAFVNASLAVLCLALGVGLVTCVVSAPPASAHAALVTITPAANVPLATAPSQVVLTFNEPISQRFAAVVVSSAEGVSAIRGTPSVSGGEVTQALRSGLVSGVYRIAYRVTSRDGHPVTGESRFTVTLTPTGPATAAPSTSTDQAANSPHGPGTTATEDPTAGPGSWLTRFAVAISGTLAVLIIGVGLASWGRRSRSWERRRH